MHTTFRRLAESVRSGGLNLREVSEALYPPIPCVCQIIAIFIPVVTFTRRLYRRLLRAHRFLPYEMRSLGDDYIKAGHFSRIPTNAVSHVTSEFRRHREATNPVHIMGFLTQWKMYLDELPRRRDAGFSGKKLDLTMFEKVSICIRPCPVLTSKSLIDVK
jgi:hypothetical protein